MKTHNISSLFCLSLFVVVITGCTVTNQRTEAPLYPATPSVSSTNLSNLVTLTPTFTSIATDTSMSTITPTAIPTLSAEQANERLLDLLSNNGGCRLPCLWGIIPGTSTPQEAQNILLPLSGISSNILTPKSHFNFDHGSVYPAYVEGDLMLQTEARYQSDNQIVSRIDFYARQEKKFVPSTGGWGLLSIFDSTTFGKRVAYYSLAHLLSEQGIPDSVLIGAEGISGSYPQIGGFKVILLYPEQGIWVRYTMQVLEPTGGKLRGCPENAHIEMELFPSGNASSFSTSVQQTHPEVSEGDKPLDEATAMSLEQFYETFRQPTDKCIETPAKLWPAPDGGG